MSETYMYEKIKDLSLTLLPDNEKLEGPEPDKTLIDSIKEFDIIYPIILSETEGGFNVVDGRRRIKACRLLERKTIKAIIYAKLSDIDEAAWTLILNDQRSDNIITEFKYYSKLAEDSDWDELRKEYGFNKSHVQKIMSLGKIKELELFTDAYEQGLIAETTLFEVAKLGEQRQEYIVEILDTKGKVALSDVREVKRMRIKKAMASLPEIEVPENTPIENFEPFMYAVAEPKSNEAVLFADIQEAYKQRDKTTGSRLFKIFEV